MGFPADPVDLALSPLARGTKNMDFAVSPDGGQVGTAGVFDAIGPVMGLWDEKSGTVGVAQPCLGDVSDTKL